MNEPHGTIIAGRWKGTRGARISKPGRSLIVRPFNDTAPTEDARIHLDPRRPIVLDSQAWEEDGG
jgi:hypothetical protein